MTHIFVCMCVCLCVYAYTHYIYIYIIYIYIYIYIYICVCTRTHTHNPSIRQHYAAGGIYICTCMDGWRDCMETVFCMKTVCVLYEDSMCACTVFVVFMYVCVCKCTYSHALYIWTCIYTHTHNLCIRKNYAAAVYIYMRTCRYLWWLVCVYMYM